MLTQQEIARTVAAIRKAEAEMDSHRAAVGQAALKRAALIGTLYDSGVSAVEIARLLGMTRTSVYRAMAVDPK